MVRQEGNITVIDNLPEGGLKRDMLSKGQYEALGRAIYPHVFPAIYKFFEDPENERGYREWYKEKHGEYPPPDDICPTYAEAMGEV